MLSMKKTEIPSHLLKFFKPRHVYKPKDDFMIPHRVYDALMADGWYGRSDIVWHKLNTMPESVRDRPTKAHEYIFLLSKSERYYYDAESIKEPSIYPDDDRKARVKAGHKSLPTELMAGIRAGSMTYAMRNKRSVWTVSTMPYSEAHFATFPPKLIEPCILAGTSARACEHCGAPWERVTSQEEVAKDKPSGKPWLDMPSQRPDGYKPTGLYSPTRNINHTIGWQPTCNHANDGTAQSIVLDPFCGAGTVPLVSIQHHRAYIGIELNPEYVKLINDRIAVVQPDLWDTAGILSVVRKRIDEATPEEADEIIARLDALIEERTA